MLTVVSFSEVANAEGNADAAAAPTTTPELTCSSDCTLIPAKDKTLWDIGLALGFNYASGNTDTTLLNIDLEGDREIDSNIYRFAANVQNGEREGDKTNDSAKVEGSYKYLLDERYYVGIGSWVLYDDIASIRYRVPVNPFLGYFWLKDAEMKFSTEAGPSYVFEKVGDETDNYLSPRVAERFEWALSKTSKFFQSAEVLFSIDDSQNVLINADAGVEAALTTTLALVLTVSNQFDNVPAEGKKPNDLSIITALKVRI